MKQCDLIIQNHAAFEKRNEENVNGDDKVGVSMDAGVKRLRGAIAFLYKKFKTDGLMEKDFLVALHQLDSLGNPEERESSPSLRHGNKVEIDLDKLLPTELELDFQDGEIKLNDKSAKVEEKIEEKVVKKEEKIRIPKVNDEKQIHKQMKQLMSTFEQEKKNLMRRVELEKEELAKMIAEDYEKKLTAEKDFLGGIIADLVKSVDDARSEVEELQMIREHDRMTLQKFFKRKMAEERKKLLLEVKTKSIKAYETERKG